MGKLEATPSAWLPKPNKPPNISPGRFKSAQPLWVKQITNNKITSRFLLI